MRILCAKPIALKQLFSQLKHDGYGLVAGAGEDPFSPSTSGEGDMEQSQIQLTGTVMRLDRVPAELRSVGRDMFSVHVRAIPLSDGECM